MKIESIYHSKNARRKECKGDRPEKKFSKDPVHHPLLLEREYVRALNSVKIERMLAKPFITALSYHKEGINKLVKDATTALFASSSYDNKVVVWDLMTRDLISEMSFSGIVNGICLDANTGFFVSQGKSVELHPINTSIKDAMIFDVRSTVTSVDVSSPADFCTGSAKGVSIFDVHRFTSKAIYDDDDTISVKYNKSFKYILSGLTNLSINLYDNRASRSFMSINAPGSTCISFNPQQGYIFAVGNEDGNAYSYDIRNPTAPHEIHRGHTNAVVSIAFSPDGNEIVTGGFDRTIRIFKKDGRKPRDCYYNDRMQIVHGVEYSNDGEFIVSGSDDGSLRLWKSHASKKVGPTTRAEKEALNYTEALKEKFKDVGEIARISKHRFLNKEIKHDMKIKHEMHEGALRRAAKREKEHRQEEEQ